MLSGHSYPFGRNGNELEGESLDTVALLESEMLNPPIFHDCPVEVVYQCGYGQKHGVLPHERIRHPVLSESIVHLVKDTFLASAPVAIFHDFYCLLGVRAAIRPETTDMDVLAFQPLEESSQRVLPVEVHIGFPVQSSCSQQRVDKQFVDFPGGIELIHPAGIRGVGDVVLRKFPYGSEDSVGTACAQDWMKRKVKHEVGADIFYTGTSTEIYTQQGTDDFVILISVSFTTESQREIYRFRQKGIKMLIMENIPPKV